MKIIYHEIKWNHQCIQIVANKIRTFIVWAFFCISICVPKALWPRYRQCASVYCVWLLLLGSTSHAFAMFAVRQQLFFSFYSLQFLNAVKFDKIILAECVAFMALIGSPKWQCISLHKCILINNSDSVVYSSIRYPCTSFVSYLFVPPFVHVHITKLPLINAIDFSFCPSNVSY